MSDVSFEKRLSALEARVYADVDIRSAIKQDHVEFESALNVTNLLVKEIMITQSEQKMTLQVQADQLAHQNFVIERRSADIEAYGELLRKHSEMFGELDRKVLVVDGKVDALGGKVEAMGGEIVALRGKVDAMDARLESVDGRFDAMEGRFGAMDGKLDLIVGMLERPPAGPN